MSNDNNKKQENFIDCRKLKIEEFEFSQGSFSKVYKGYYPNRPVCVKVIKKDNVDPDLLVFINREIDILKDLILMRHKNIVEFIGVGEKEKLLFLVTELVNGGDLGAILRDDSIQIPWNLKLHMARGIAEGMKFLHFKNIMHRDLKSNNLLVGENWEIKICDFGFAKIITPQTLTTTICGTDEWMSPEVILGMPYSYSSDIYSYGMVLVELITQYRLEQRLPQNNFDVDVDLLSSMVPADCPERLWKLALKCASYYPKDRPSFDEIIQELDSTSQEWLATAKPEDTTYPPSPHSILNPNFDDENCMDHWCVLSNLPDNCLDSPPSNNLRATTALLTKSLGSFIMRNKPTLSQSTVNVTPPSKAPSFNDSIDDDYNDSTNNNTKHQQWYCSLM